MILVEGERSDYFEDLNKDSFEKLLEDISNNVSPIPGSRVGRFSSEPSKMTKKLIKKGVSKENASLERFRG